MIDKSAIDRIFSEPIAGIDHFSACSMGAAHVGKNVNGLKLLELGTGYGGQLKFLLPVFLTVTSIDVMYDWVPDLKPDQPFDLALVDRKKIDIWEAGVATWREKIKLIVESTFTAHMTQANLLSSSGPFDVLIVDACHHPASSVEADFWNYVPFMADEFFVVFDDVHETDSATARDDVIKKLTSSGRMPIVRAIQNGGIAASLLYVPPTENSQS